MNWTAGPAELVFGVTGIPGVRSNSLRAAQVRSLIAIRNVALLRSSMVGALPFSKGFLPIASERGSQVADETA